MAIVKIANDISNYTENRSITSFFFNFLRLFPTTQRSYQLKTHQLKTSQLNDFSNYTFQLHVSRAKIINEK